MTVPGGDYLVFISVDFQRYSQEVTTKGTYIIKPIFFSCFLNISETTIIETFVYSLKETGEIAVPKTQVLTS